MNFSSFWCLFWNLENRLRLFLKTKANVTFTPFLIMNPDFSIFSATESLSTNDLVVFAADWKTRTFHRHLTCSVISSELCRKTSFVAEGGSSLIEIIEFCGVIARSPTGKARLCGSEGGSRAADSLFMRRVLLRESLTVIPLMKWKYIFSCRRIWKCLGGKKV